MGLNSCMKCIKYSLFAFNFIFWAIGCALVGVGIWVIVDAKKFLDVYNEKVPADVKETVGTIDENIVEAAGIAIIVIGGVIMISGFLGCCGAIRESQAMLSMFFAMLLLIFVALIAIGAVALVKRDWIKTMLEKTLNAEADSNGSSVTGTTLLQYGNENVNTFHSTYTFQ